MKLNLLTAFDPQRTFGVSSIAIAYLAGTLGDFLRRSDKTQIYLNRAAGIIFVGFALKLVFTRTN